MDKFFYPGPGVTWQNLHNVMLEPDAEHIFDCSFEPEAYFEFSRSDTIFKDRDKHLEFLEYHNTTETKPLCKVLTCGFDFHTSGRKYKNTVGKVVAMEDFPIVPEWSEVIEWKTRVFHNAILERRDFLDKAQDFTNSLDLQKLFVSLNNRPKVHRVQLMKVFMDRDVVERGVIRFANNLQQWRKTLNDKNFTGEYFNKLISYAPNFFSPFGYDGANLGHREWFLDPYYFTGLFDIVAETCTEINLISQKSIQPVLFKKPFCIIGSANQNTIMKDMGFEIFDEFFDFSNESKNLPSIRTRTQQYAHYDNMLKDLWDLDDSPQALKHLYKSLLTKFEHNLDRLIKIIFDDDFVPDIVLEHPESNAYKIVQKSRECAIQDPYYKKYLPV